MDGLLFRKARRKIFLMKQTIEAVIDASGRVRLLEPVTLTGQSRALVTILDDELSWPGNEPVFLSEPALEDLNRTEEDEAWSRLQQAR